MDHRQEREKQRTDTYCNSGGFRSPTIGPTLHGNSSRAIREKPYARNLALVSTVLVLPICWRIGVYTWRFMHTVDGKRMYKTTAR
jgi:hypothetical protein